MTNLTGHDYASPFQARAAAAEALLALEAQREQAADPFTGNDELYQALGAAVMHARSAFMSAMLRIARDCDAHGATHPHAVEGIAACTPLTEEDIMLIQGEALTLQNMLP